MARTFLVIFAFLAVIGAAMCVPYGTYGSHASSLNHESRHHENIHQHRPIEPHDRPIHDERPIHHDHGHEHVHDRPITFPHNHGGNDIFKHHSSHVPSPSYGQLPHVSPIDAHHHQHDQHPSHSHHSTLEHHPSGYGGYKHNGY